MSTITARQARERRHRRVRGKVAGTAERPRLAVFRSNRGIFSQIVDDASGKTLAGASWITVKGLTGNKTDQAKAVGLAVAEAAKKKAPAKKAAKKKAAPKKAATTESAAPAAPKPAPAPAAWPFPVSGNRPN